MAEHGPGGTGRPGVDARLRRLAEASLHDRPEHLDEVLSEMAASAMDLAGGTHARLSVYGAHGGKPHVVVVGDAPADGGGARLELPIVLRGRAAGTLTLSAPAGREFTADDERAVVTVVGAIANVVEQARTVAENARRKRWLTGATELVRELAAGRHRNPLKLIVERLVDVADADLAYVVQAGASDETVVVTAAAGLNAHRWEGYVLPAATSAAAEVLRTGEPQNYTQLPENALPDDVREQVDIEIVLLVPMRGTHSNRGVLAVSRRRGGGPFTFGDLGMATMFAGQVGLALELADVQARRDQLALVEERDRIARDLHDHVIQRLFAVGLSLQSAGLQLGGSGNRTADQVQSSIDEIDETIKQIRSTIYRLTQPIVAPHGSIRTQASRMLDDLELALGFRPSLTFDGPVDFGIDDDVIDDGVAVLREALTNIARHAQASRGDVAVRVAGGALTITVRDDGRGIGDTSRRSGLANMRTRAERRSGTLEVETSSAPTESKGTTLRWSVPITLEPTTAVD